MPEPAQTPRHRVARPAGMTPINISLLMAAVALLARVAASKKAHGHFRAPWRWCEEARGMCPPVGRPGRVRGILVSGGAHETARCVPPMACPDAIAAGCPLWCGSASVLLALPPRCPGRCETGETQQ
jgi:hypothetical protein